MTTELRDAIARLRDRPSAEAWRNRDVLLVCDELEDRLKPAPAFDKVAYQREYMRRRRAEEKLKALEYEIENADILGDDR